MPRRRKRLVDLVRDGTFLSRKDRELLAGREPLPWEALEDLRDRYINAPSDRVRQEIGLQLERDLRRPHGSEKYLGNLHAELAKLGRRGSYRRLEGFAGRYFRHFKGPKAGQAFTFDPFQSRYLQEFYRRDRHWRRHYQVGLWGIPKGNGKTPTSAVLATESLASALDMPEVYVLSGAKDQADNCHEFARVNVEHGPLSAWLEVGNQTIRCPSNAGEFEVLSGDGDFAAGVNPTTGICDELWLFRHRKQREGYRSIAEALHKREGESYLLNITTAGYDRATILGETYDAAIAHPKLQVLDGGFHLRLRDREAGFLFDWYCAPDDADIENPETIRRANPASWVNPEGLLRSLYRADTDENDWRRLHLNQWRAARSAFLPTGCWASLRSERQPRAIELDLDREEEIPNGAPIYVTIDAGHSWDTTAVVWSWRSPDGRVVQRCRVFSCREKAPAHVRVAGETLDNEELVEPFIHELGDRYKVLEVVYDPRYFVTEGKHLSERFTTAEMYPWSAEMSDAVVGFEKGCRTGDVSHDGDLVFARHVANADAVRTENRTKIARRNEDDPIDACTAAAIGYWRAAREHIPEKPASPPDIVWV